MAKFDPNKPVISHWAPDQSTVLAAAAAVESLARWQHCDCGCPNQCSPADKESVDFLRIAAMIRVKLLPE